MRPEYFNGSYTAFHSLQARITRKSFSCSRDFFMHLSYKKTHFVKAHHKKRLTTAFSYMGLSVFFIFKTFVSFPCPYNKKVLKKSTELSYISRKTRLGRALSDKSARFPFSISIEAAAAIIPALSPQRRRGGKITLMSVRSVAKRSRKP